MALLIGENPVPMKIDEDGVIRIGGTRVPLDAIVYAFQEGASVEEIVLRYPALRLTDVYSVVAYYLNHRDEIDSYLETEKELDELAHRQTDTTHSNMANIRQRLLARQASQGH